MTINEAITAYIEETKAKRRHAENLRNIRDKRFNPEQFPTTAAKIAAVKARREEIEAAAAELEALDIEIKIRHDNARRMIYNAALPAALEILQKWNGKPYGEKTKAKINEAMKARFNCALYISNQFGGKITFTPLNAEGYADYNFNYSDFEIYTRYNKDGHQPHMLNDNKINGTITADQLRLDNCPEIIPDPATHAREILDKFQELKRQQEQLENKISAFNAMLPSTIDRRHISGIKTYL